MSLSRKPVERKQGTVGAALDASPLRARALSSVDVATLARLRALLSICATPADALLSLARQGTRGAQSTARTRMNSGDPRPTEDSDSTEVRERTSPAADLALNPRLPGPERVYG